MKTPALISLLRRVFTWLYSLQMLVIIVVPPLLILALWGLPKWQLSRYDLSKDGSRIIYATESSKPTYNHSTGDTYSSTYQNDTLISRQESRGDSMYTYDAKGKLLKAMPLETQLGRSHSDSVIRADLMHTKHKADSAYARRNEYEIDSILRADPTVYILREGSRYTQIGRSFGTYITLNLHGEAHLSSHNPAPVYRLLNQPKPLNYSLSEHHLVTLTDRPSGSANHRVVFDIHTLADYLAVPLPVLIWHICRLLFNIISGCLTIFVEWYIFGNLSDGSSCLVRRVVKSAIRYNHRCQHCPPTHYNSLSGQPSNS